MAERELAPFLSRPAEGARLPFDTTCIPAGALARISCVIFIEQNFGPRMEQKECWRRRWRDEPATEIVLCSSLSSSP